MIAYINKLKDKIGNQQLPVTHERAVRDDNGTTTETKFQNLEGAMDKVYVASSDNGMGRITLKKNIVSSVNTLTQSMMTQTNTIYVIQYDFTLASDITIPANCVLEFAGGSISGNHIITLNGTEVIGNVKFVNCSFAGTFSNKWIHSKWFSTTVADKSTILNNLLSIHKFIDFDDISYETYDTVIVYTHSNIRNLRIDNKDTNTTHSVISVTPDGSGAILNIDGLFISAENALEIGVDFGLIRYSRFNNLDIQGNFKYALQFTQVFVSSLNNCRIAGFREKGIYIPSGHYSTSFDINHVYFINGRGTAIDIYYLSYSSFKGIYCDNHDGTVEGLGGVYVNLAHANAVSIESIGCEGSAFYRVFSFTDNSYVTITNACLSFTFKASDRIETYIVFGSKYTKCSSFTISITGSGNNEYRRGFWSNEGEVLSENITNDGELSDTTSHSLNNKNHYNINKLIKLIPTS